MKKMKIFKNTFILPLSLMLASSVTLEAAQASDEEVNRMIKSTDYMTDYVTKVQGHLAQSRMRQMVSQGDVRFRDGKLEPVNDEVVQREGGQWQYDACKDEEQACPDDRQFQAPDQVAQDMAQSPQVGFPRFDREAARGLEEDDPAEDRRAREYGQRTRVIKQSAIHSSVREHDVLALINMLNLKVYQQQTHQYLRNYRISTSPTGRRQLQRQSCREVRVAQAELRMMRFSVSAIPVDAITPLLLRDMSDVVDEQEIIICQNL